MAAREIISAVTLRGKMMNRNKEMKMRMKTEGSKEGKQAAVVARAARSVQEKCEMKRRSLAVTMTVTTMSPRTQPGAAEMRAAAVRTKEEIEAAGVVAPPLRTATAAVVIQSHMLKVEVAVSEAQIPLMAVTVNSICALDCFEMASLPIFFQLHTQQDDAQSGAIGSYLRVLGHLSRIQFFICSFST